MLLVAAGVVLVRGPEGHADARAILAVATIAASIAAYTLVDRVGIQHAGALTYFVLVLAGPCLVYPPLVGIAARCGASSACHALVAAAANLGSFVLGLLALRRGAAAPVLAVRSSSIVIATLLAGRVLAEHVSRGRLAGSIARLRRRRAARALARLSRTRRRPGKRVASSRTSSAPGSPTTFR